MIRIYFVNGQTADVTTASSVQIGSWPTEGVGTALPLDNALICKDGSDKEVGRFSIATLAGWSLSERGSAIGPRSS